MKLLPLSLLALSALALHGCTKSAASPVPDNGPLGGVRLAMPQSEGLPAPRADTSKATWRTAPDGDAAVFGHAGEGPLLTVACRQGVLMVTRHSHAEVGAQALFALQGAGYIVRIPVDATAIPGQRGYFWQGTLNPANPGAAVFQSAFNGTLPGGGMIKVSAGEPLREVLRRCKGHPAAPSPTSAPLDTTTAE